MGLNGERGPDAGAVTVLLVADVRLYLEGLARILADRGFDVVTAAAVEDAYRLATERRPDVVLLGLGLTDGMILLRWLGEHVPEAKTIVVGAGESESEVISWAEAGVGAYVTREESLEELIEGIRRLERGETLCTPRIAATLLRHVAEGRHETRLESLELRLTRREREVVPLVDAGLSNKEIALRLGISVATVKNHVHHILAKLSAQSRGEAAARLRRRGASAVEPLELERRVA